jgi:hypothetical protein
MLCIAVKKQHAVQQMMTQSLAGVVVKHVGALQSITAKYARD